MSAVRPNSLQALPILTEVIDLPSPTTGDGDEAGAMPVAAAPDAAVDTPAGEAAAISEDEVVQRVLADLQRHGDVVLEQRLREAMMPALARLSDALVADLRQEFAATLRETVARAVSLELARRRQPGP